MTSVFIAPSSTPAKTMESFASDEQSESKVRRVWERVSPLLVPGETIEHLVVQTMAAMTVLPGALVLTNHRALFASGGLIRLAFNDLKWRFLMDAHLSHGLMGSTVNLLDVHNRRWEIAHLPKVAASHAYAYAQTIEDLATAFRRDLHLEETRAAARGVAVTNQEKEVSLSPSPAESIEQTLVRLKKLLDNQLITQEEFEAKRAEVLNRL